MEIFGYNEYHKHKHTALMSKLQNVVIQNSISNVIAYLIFGEILLYSPDLEIFSLFLIDLHRLVNSHFTEYLFDY
jgi:hypothetical protein